VEELLKYPVYQPPFFVLSKKSGGLLSSSPKPNQEPNNHQLIMTVSFDLHCVGPAGTLSTRRTAP
jgi:hypothetical protein